MPAGEDLLQPATRLESDPSLYDRLHFSELTVRPEFPLSFLAIAQASRIQSHLLGPGLEISGRLIALENFDLCVLMQLFVKVAAKFFPLRLRQFLTDLRLHVFKL